MPGPDLPVLVLKCGPWRAEVLDPRADPLRLGARYMHGGYVHALDHDGRRLTGRAKAAWNSFDGEGLPESFELPFAHAACAEGEEYLRLGAGRCIRRGPAPRMPDEPLVRGVAWQVLEHGTRVLRMRCRDGIVRDGWEHAYQLERLLVLRGDGLDSRTTLTLRHRWTHPVQWFPHPFWAQDAGDGVGFALPPGAEPRRARSRWLAGVERDASGRWRFPTRGGLTWVDGLWGGDGAVVCHLPARRGGGALAMTCDRPWNHLVLWASPSAASAEPQLGRIWPDGETAGWTLRYRWLTA